MGRVLTGYAVAPLAAAVTAAFVLVVQDRDSLPFLLQMILWFYGAALLIGAPACFVLRMLPTRSMILYVLWGGVVGAIMAPAIQLLSDSWSHGHQQPAVSNLAWQVVRMALAGGVGFGVFWLIVMRGPK